MLKRKWVYTGLAALVVGLATAGWAIQGPDFAGRNLSGLEGDVDRGAYVARLSGCIACHTDVKSGRGVLAGGTEIETDFGSFFPPNITPHPEDGIGDWSLDDFSRALTLGLDPDGKHYFPSFPYPFYTRLGDQQIVDLWAAVQSVPAVDGGPPPHGLRFPFGFHEGVGVWQRMFFEAGELDPVPAKSDSWNRGRVLAQGPAHCGACHTPRNLLGARIESQRYEGGEGPGGEKIPAITATVLEERGWTKEDLIYALRTGVMPDGDNFGGSMAEVVVDGTRYWTDADLSALAEYIFHPEVN